MYTDLLTLIDLFDKIYGKNAAEHIITGKAIRGHFLVGTALYMLLSKPVFPEYNEDRKNAENVFFEELSQLYDKLFSKEASWEEVSKRNVIVKFSADFETHKTALRHLFRAAKL